jgi:hypothetical protein
MFGGVRVLARPFGIGGYVAEAMTPEMNTETRKRQLKSIKLWFDPLTKNDAEHQKHNCWDF